MGAGIRYSELRNSLWRKFVKSTNEKQLILEELQGLLGETLDMQTVLDLGAGSGEITIPLSEKALFVKAVEPENEWCKQLEDGRAAPAGQTAPRRLLLHPGRWESANICEKYDVVLVSHSFSYIPHPFREFALRKAHEWAKEGGRIVLVTSAETGKFAEVLKKATALVRHPRWMDYELVRKALEEKKWKYSRKTIQAELRLPAREVAEIIACFSGADAREFDCVATFAEKLLWPQSTTVDSEMFVVEKKIECSFVSAFFLVQLFRI